MATNAYPLSTPAEFTSDDVTEYKNTTESTSSTTGSVITAGGIGCAKNINAGGHITKGNAFLYRYTTVATPITVTLPTLVIIPMATNIRTDSTYTVGVSDDTFTVTEAGYYKITVAVGVENTSGLRSTVKFMVLKNGTALGNRIPGSVGAMYSRNAANGDVSASVQIIDNLNATDTLRVAAGVDAGSTNINILPEATRIMIERI